MSKLIFNTSGFVDSDNPDNYTSKSSFIIDKDLSSLIFEFSGGGKPVYFHVTDPDGLVRVQFLGKQGPKTTVLHKDESGSGIGTCPGKIRKGKWMITAFAFGARCSSSSGKVDYEVKVFENTYKSNPDNLYSSWLNLKEFNSGRIFLKAFENSQNIQGGNEPSEINDEECRWLKGDFHVHSYLSDGSSSPAELLEEGLNKKLDFFL